MSILRALLLLAAGAPAAALAQPAAPAQNEAATSAACAPKAALYQAGKGAKVWVLRQGTMVLAENPLRPLTRDETIVLEVVVNGRRATAHGPDVEHLRQGGSPKTIEREGREPIRWAEAAAAPAAIRVIAEDGRVLMGPMPFGGCEDAPAAKAVADAPAKPEPGKRKGKAATAATDDPMPANLPQGAIEGLSLPKGGARR